MNNQTFNVIQSLLFSYVRGYKVNYDKIACPCIDCNSGYAIITVWNTKGVPENRIISFDPYELDEDDEGLYSINVYPVPLYSVGDYDSAFKFLALFLCEKLSSIQAVGYSPYLRVFDVENLLNGKVIFTGLGEG